MITYEEALELAKLHASDAEQARNETRQVSATLAVAYATIAVALK